MGNAARSVFVFGLYLAVIGAIFVTVPNFFLVLNRFPPTNEVWIRVVGVLVLCLAYYYVRAGRRGLTDFFRWTVTVRSFVFLAFCAFVLLRLTQPMLVVFGIIDLLGAIWTALALRGAGGGA